jgi:DNA repair protein RadC
MLKSTRKFREVIVKKDGLIVCEAVNPYGATPRTLDHPQAIADLWPMISGTPDFRDGQENVVVIYLNTRRGYLGHSVVSVGTVDQCTVHPREVFRGAVMANAHAIILIHNHPSGNPSPSEADIRVTRDIKRAGELMKIELLDHVVMGTKCEGNKGWASLRELGYF